jgi:hypothetical protein
MMIRLRTQPGHADSKKSVLAGAIPARIAYAAMPLNE